MNEKMMDLLECPLCNEELSWKIDKRVGENIITGSAICKKCFCEYPIRNSIAVFLEPKLQNVKIWNRKEKWMKRYLDKNPNVTNQMLELSDDQLSTSDLRLRANLMYSVGKYKEAEALNKLFISKSMLDDSFKVVDEQIELCIKNICSHDGNILDIASGKCYLITKLINGFSGHVIASDINPMILERDLLMMEQLNLQNRVSFIAFNVKKSPFKNGAISMMTTLVGLQNILNTENTLSELRRICSGNFFSISSFCKEDDAINVEAVERIGMRSMWIKSEYEKAFEKAGWKLEWNNSSYAKVPAVKVDNSSKLERQMMKFPLTDTIFEYCLTNAK